LFLAVSALGTQY